MKYTYESVETFSNIFYIKRTDELGGEAWIPTDPANSDYQAYLATLASKLSNPSTPQAGA
jgi:hypothetical protein